MLSFFSPLARIAALAAFVNYAFALAPSDSWRDADIGQSSYLGGANNMNPAVVDSPQFGLLWKKPMNKDEKFYAKVLVYTPPSTGTQILFTASSQNWIRTFNAKTGEPLLTRQVARPFLQSDIGCTDIPESVLPVLIYITRTYTTKQYHWYHRNTYN